MKSEKSKKVQNQQTKMETKSAFARIGLAIYNQTFAASISQTASNTQK